MALSDLLVDAGPSVYYDSAFRAVLEDHLTLLRERYSSLLIIEPDEAYQWRGDLYGLLHAKNEPRHMHWLIMRLNQFTSPVQYHEDVLTLLKPDYTFVGQILQSHQSTTLIS